MYMVEVVAVMHEDNIDIKPKDKMGLLAEPIQQKRTTPSKKQMPEATEPLSRKKAKKGEEEEENEEEELDAKKLKNKKGLGKPSGGSGKKGKK
jgi:hypothetical protein